MEQLSLFDLMADYLPKAQTFTPDQELAHALKRGSGFADGKIRIALMYAKKPAPWEAARFLKEEYGIGGGSHTLLNGERGFVEYNGKGITVSGRGFKEVASDNWPGIERTVRELVERGQYLDSSERARYLELLAQDKKVFPRTAIA